MIASEMGYEIAQNNVGYLIETGKVDISKEEGSKIALLHYSRSAIQNNADSLVKVGDYFYYGKGVDPDKKKAASMYLLAEKQGSSIAMFNLGYMYETGAGVPVDFHLAKRFYDLSLKTQPVGWVIVNLMIMKLYAKHFINWISRGGTLLLDSPVEATEATNEEIPIPEVPSSISEDIESDDSNNNLHDEETEGSGDEFLILLLAMIAGFLVYARQ